MRARSCTDLGMGVGEAVRVRLHGVLGTKRTKSEQFLSEGVATVGVWRSPSTGGKGPSTPLERSLRLAPAACSQRAKGWTRSSDMTSYREIHVPSALSALRGRSRSAVAPNAHRTFAPLLAAILGLAACSSEESGGGGSEKVCVPGKTEACFGAGQCAGVQACNANGTGFGECQCAVGGSGGGGGGGAGGGGTAGASTGGSSTGGGAGTGTAGASGSGGSSGAAGSGGACAADLMTDPFNCGECGRECEAPYRGEGGANERLDSCVAGACTPYLAECIVESDGFKTCSDYCQSLGEACEMSCVNPANGQAWGARAFTLGEVDCIAQKELALTVFDGDCTTEILWSSQMNVRCCCTDTS